MEASINGHSVLRFEAVESVSGAWTARVEADLDDGELAGSVQLTAGDETWAGTVQRGRVESGRWVGELVGGAGGLDRALPARFYLSTSFASLAADVLSMAGERLDDAEHQSDALAAVPARWQRSAGTARAALSAIAKATGSTWRVTRSGGVAFVRSETWAELVYEHAERRGDPGSALVYTAPTDTPAARPGRTVGGFKVASVRTLIAPDGTEQVLTVGEADDSSPEAILADAMRRAAAGAALYAQWYPAKVVQQDADGTLHLMPDDERVRGDGLTNVPMRHGIPGLTVKVQAGSYVRLFFEDADPQRPAAALWPDGSSVASVAWDVDALTVGAGTDAMVLGGQLVQWLQQLTVPTAMGPSGTPINAPALQAILSRKHKVD